MIPELVTIWCAIVAYAVSAALFIIGIVLGKERPVNAAVVAATVGLVSQAAAIAVRWVRLGHGPLVGFYEVALILSFVSVLGFLLLQWRYPGLRIAGIAVMPICFLMLGAVLLVSPDVSQVQGTLASFWLVIHVIFATLAFGMYAAASALAVTYLLRDSKWGERLKPWLDRLPSQDVLDSLTFKIVGAGFLFQGIMIASGAIWANEAWGRYWGWDAIETWSLVAWAVYAVYLHLTLTMGWRGRRAAWVLILGLAVIVFSTLGVPLVFHSIHGAYIST